MGVSLGFFEWLERRLVKPADQSLLLREGKDHGSEAMITADTPDAAKSAARTVRINRARRTRRWRFF